MRCTPKKNKKGAIVSLCLTLTGGVGLIASVTAQIRYAVLIQMVALFLFILGFEFFYRYEMTVFVYLLEGDDFLIIRKVGKKEQYVCNLAMSTALSLIPTPRGRAARRILKAEYGTIPIRYNHAQTMRPSRPYSALFDFNGRVAEIVFEPDDAMITTMNSRISENENDKI